MSPCIREYAKNGWIYLAYTEPVAGYVAPPPQPPAPAPDPAAAAAGRGRGGRGGPPSPPSMTVFIRGKIDKDNRWVEEQLIYRAPIRAVHAERLALRHALPLRQARARLLQPGRARRHDQRAGSVQASRQDPSRQRRRHRFRRTIRSSTRRTRCRRSGATAIATRRGWRGIRSGLLWESEHGPTGGDEINIIEKGKNYGWGVTQWACRTASPSAATPGMDEPIVYFTPTIAPSGIGFYTGSKYPGWKNNLFVAASGGPAVAPARDQRTKGDPPGSRLQAVRPRARRDDRTRWPALCAAAKPDGLGHGARACRVDAGNGDSTRAGEVADDTFHALIKQTMNRTRIVFALAAVGVVGLAAAIAGPGHRQGAGQHLAARQEADGEVHRAVARGGDEDLLAAAGIPRRARRLGPDDRVADPDGLRSPTAGCGCSRC